MAHTLLLADDSITIQRVIELTFAEEDVDVVAVSDGEQAIAALERSAPDIVLADVAMPGCSGYDVARHVKQTPHLAHIPVILLAAAFEPIDRVRATAVGCDAVLSKPFEPQLVVGRVRELLAKSQRPSEPGDAGMSRDATPGATLEGLATREPPRPPSPAEIDRYFDQLDAAFARLASPTGADRTAALEPTTSSMDDVSQPPRLPLLAEAFAALLAAEQVSPPPVAPPRWPAASPMTEELVDSIVRRVLDRLTDRVMRERVDEIVGTVAERLVREEIERIKSAIE